MPFLEEIFIRFLFLGFPCVILGNHIKLYNGRIPDERMDCPRLCVYFLSNLRGRLRQSEERKSFPRQGQRAICGQIEALIWHWLRFRRKKFDSDVKLLTNMCHEAFTRQFTPVALRCFHFLSKREKKKKNGKLQDRHDMRKQRKPMIVYPPDRPQPFLLKSFTNAINLY